MSTQAYRYAQAMAVTERARGRAEEERAWLDLLALLDAPAPAPSVVPEAAVEALREWGVDEGDVAALREAAVEAVTWKLIDRTSDLADRAPSDETWRTANADARTALPLLTAASSATREDVEIDRACAWADYRAEYGVRAEHMGEAHKAFLAGWDAARGAEMRGALR